MSQNVITRCDARRNFDHPRRALVDKLIIAPSPRHCCVVNQTNTINLEEFKLMFVNSLAATCAATGEVVNDGSVVRIGPIGPLQEDSVTRGYNRMSFGIGRIVMANDVRGRVPIWLHGQQMSYVMTQRKQIEHTGFDEPICGVWCTPSDHRWWGVCVWVATNIPTTKRDTVNHYVCDMAMRCHQRGEEGGCEKGIHRGLI